MTDIQVEVRGLDELRAKFGGLPPMLRASLARAGRRYAPVVLDQQGVRAYPPLGPGNAPPVPYYVRGVGTQYASFNRGESEQYGMRFTIETADTKTTIGNTASYAKWLAGEYSQAAAMARIGWKKLVDAAKQTRTAMIEIYTQEVKSALRALRLT